MLSLLMERVAPFFKKPVMPGRITNVDTLEPLAALGTFHYPALPLHSLKAVWSIQDMTDITRGNFKTLTLLHGEDDRSVDINSLVSLLERNGMPFNKQSFKNSGHNILEDYDREDAVQAVVKAVSAP